MNLLHFSLRGTKNARWNSFQWAFALKFQIDLLQFYAGNTMIIFSHKARKGAFMGRLDIIKTIVSDMIGFRQQNRINIFSTAEPSSKVSIWQTWVTNLKLTTCDYCFEQRGKIFSHENELGKKPPVHNYCGCQIETLTSIKAGTATKDQKEGADWYLYYQSTLPDYYIR